MVSAPTLPPDQSANPTPPPPPNPFDASVPQGLANFYSAVRRTLALTAPDYTVRFRTASATCRLFSLALALVVFGPDAFRAYYLRVPWSDRPVAVLLAISSATLLLMTIVEVTFFRPTVFRELTGKTHEFFDRLGQGYPAVRAVLTEVRSTPTDTVSHAANKIEMIALATNAALLPNVLRIVTMLRLISRIFLTMLLIAAFGMSLNLATAGDVVRSIDAASPASTNSLDYLGFSSTFFLGSDTSIIVRASGWADIYILLNSLAILSIGSFVIASVMALFSSHDDMVSRAALKLIAIECKL